MWGDSVYQGALEHSVQNSFALYYKVGVSLEYVPLDDGRTPLIRNKESITAGMKLQAVHHNSFNHKTVSTGDVVMTVKKLMVEREFKLSFKKQAFRVSPGVCYAVLKQAHLVHEHIKAPLDPSKDLDLRKAVEDLQKK